MLTEVKESPQTSSKFCCHLYITRWQLLAKACLCIFISHFHTKATVSNSAYSHKRPVVVIIWQMTASWWSLPSSTWIPLHSMGTEYRTILSGLLLHSINVLTPPKSVGADPQNEQAKFCTIHISCRKSTPLRLIKKSSCCLCLPFCHGLTPASN